MKKIKVIIVVLLLIIGIGIGTTIILYNYNKNTLKVYSCKYNESQEENVYEYYVTKPEEDENYKCEIVKKMNCKNCTIWGYDSGIEYNDTKLLLFHNSSKREVYIYDTEKFELYDTIQNVYIDKNKFQRKDYQTYLYDKDNLIGLIFPDKENNEILYMLKTKEIITIGSKQEFYRNTNITYYTNMKEDDRVVNQSKYVNTAPDGKIQVKGTGYEYGVYDLYNKKILIPFEKGHFLNTDNGYIRYYDGTFNRETSIVTLYNKDGEKIFSSEETDQFKYNDPWIIDIISENLILIIDIGEYDGLVFIDAKGKVLAKIPLSMKTLKKDILNKINNNEVKSKLEFDNRIPAYYENSFDNTTNGNITVYFYYSDNDYNVNAMVGYEIDLTNNSITLIK